MTVDALDYLLTHYAVPAGTPSPIQLRVCRVPDQVRLYAALGLRVGAEIGVDRGLFAADICRHNPGVKLYGVDPWQPYPEYGEKYSQAYADECRAEAVGRLAPYGVTLIRKMSLDAAADFADGSLDFVYIDGNHAYDFVKADIAAWAPKVRAGGVVSGHDYCHPRAAGRRQFFGVVQAVNEYVAANKIDPWFIFRGKGCSGWLWVKE